MELNARLLRLKLYICNEAENSSAVSRGYSLSCFVLVARLCAGANGSTEGKFARVPDRPYTSGGQGPIAAAGLDWTDRYFLRWRTRREPARTKPARHASGSRGVIQDRGEAGIT